MKGFRLNRLQTQLIRPLKEHEVSALSSEKEKTPAQRPWFMVLFKDPILHTQNARCLKASPGAWSLYKYAALEGVWAG